MNYIPKCVFNELYFEICIPKYIFEFRNIFQIQNSKIYLKEKYIRLYKKIKA